MKKNFERFQKKRENFEVKHLSRSNKINRVSLSSGERKEEKEISRRKTKKDNWIRLSGIKE